MQTPLVALQKTCAVGKAASTYEKQISVRRVHCTCLRHAAHTGIDEVIVGNYLGSPVVVGFLMVVVFRAPCRGSLIPARFPFALRGTPFFADRVGARREDLESLCRCLCSFEGTKTDEVLRRGSAIHSRRLVYGGGAKNAASSSRASKPALLFCSAIQKAVSFGFSTEAAPFCYPQMPGF